MENQHTEINGVAERTRNLKGTTEILDKWVRDEATPYHMGGPYIGEQYLIGWD